MRDVVTGDWFRDRSLAHLILVGIEGTGSYGAALARHVSAAGARVVEAGRSDRQGRRRQGKSHPLDAISAARAAQSGRACGEPKGRRRGGGDPRVDGGQAQRTL
jgi:transposase